MGPCLFLFYINDLANTLRSEVRLVADATVVYLSVAQQQDASILQQDLEKWEKKWGMEFHPGKCQVLIFTRRRVPVYFEYKLHGLVLENVRIAKYLEVTFQNDMPFTNHINKITSSTTGSLSFLRRNLNIDAPQLKTTAYKGLVRPLIEYACTVWDAIHSDFGICQIEKVQR